MIIGWFRQCGLEPNYNKDTGVISCVYLGNKIIVSKNGYGTYSAQLYSFEYISTEVKKLLTTNDTELQLNKKYYGLVNSITIDFDNKHKEIDDSKIFNKPLTFENGLEIIKLCKNLSEKIVDIVNKELPSFVNNVKKQLDDKVSNGNKLKYNITYYLNTASNERREETLDDVDNDYYSITRYFNTDLEAFEYVMTDILDVDLDDFYEDETTDDEKIKSIINYFKGQDFGDGEVIICKVSGKNYNYDTGLTKESFMDMVSGDY